MKKVILTIILITGLNAQANFFQENCSSSDASTKLSVGHVENQVSVTEHTWVSGKLLKKEISFSFKELYLEGGKPLIIKEVKTNLCKPGDKTAILSWVKIQSRRLTIEKEDGSLFSRSTVGVSPDRASVNAYMICKQEGNSITNCP